MGNNALAGPLIMTRIDTLTISLLKWIFSNTWAHYWTQSWRTTSMWRATPLGVWWTISSGWVATREGKSDLHNSHKLMCFNQGEVRPVQSGLCRSQQKTNGKEIGKMVQKDRAWKKNSQYWRNRRIPWRVIMHCVFCLYKNFNAHNV